MAHEPLLKSLAYREFHIQYGAWYLPELAKWQPTLVITRLTGTPLHTKSKSFTDLPAVFETAKTAADLARASALAWIDIGHPRLPF